MKRERALLVLILASLVPGCRRRIGEARVLPSPISIELSGPAGAPPGELAPRLAAIGASSFFVPAVAATADGETASFRALPVPAGPFPGRVYLEVSGRGDFDAALARDPVRAASDLWRALEPATRAARNVAGVHLAWRVSRSAKGEAVVLAEVRRRISARWTVSAAIASRIPEKNRKGWQAVARNADFLVAEMFGRGEDADPAGFVYSASLADAAGLRVPVYAGYAPQGWGVLRSSAGQARSILSDAAINELSEDRRFDFSFGDVLSDPDENVYVFSPLRAAVSPRWDGPARPGDTITFRERRTGDFTRALAEGRAAPGKVVRIATFEEDGRWNGLGVLEDVLLGRSLEPKLVFSRAGEGDGAIVVVNAAAESSDLSRINTWFDVTVRGARILDVRPGDFDRFLFLDERGRPVVAPRARTIRFFESFIAAGESMRTGPIRLSGRAQLSVAAHVATLDGNTLTTPDTPLE
ncbi:MAG TPA: hypothetical protein VFS34_01325 [Thermoanaerobaculia bacterium]|nr:hypothetical protein [Thermoanaerobaculia bacterium]